MFTPPNLIPPTKVLAGSIAIYENVWPDWEETIERIEEVTSIPTSNVLFKPATLNMAGLNNIEEGSYKNLRTNSHLSLSHMATIDNTMREVHDKFFNICISTVSDYAERFGILEPITFVEEFNLLKYQTGEEYKAHYDGGTATHRSISPILYLNDSYTGGEIEFVNFDLKIKPKAGTMIVFPANYPYRHIAHPVKTGIKYAIVTWLHDQDPVN